MSTGYSARPQHAKLGLREGQRLASDAAPAGWAVIDPPPGIELVGAGDPADVSAITDHTIRDQALPLGIVDVKVAAINDDWSGLRLVWRKENR